MFTRTFGCLTLALALGLSATAWAESNGARPNGARLGTYEKNGQGFFALSLMPQDKADATQKNEVVILVDTSASQAGRYRTEAMEAVRSMLAGLSANDRVQLMAVDMKATPMSAGFVDPQGPEMQAALAKLNGRTPLGATDLEAGLRSGATSFSGSGAVRTVIYVGDAMSKANVVTDATFRKLVGELRGEKVAVSSYVLGKERNMHVMAALANHTGGVVETDRPEDNQAEDKSAADGGRRLAASVQASIFWPSEASLSSNVSASYPSDLPPVRTDRDSILIGTLDKMGAVQVETSGTMNGRAVKWTWTAAAEKPSEDFGFLPKLVDMAASDKGLSLPTAGSAALREAAYVTLNSAQMMAKLGHEALASGNFAGAEKVAEAALARDPGNPKARAIKETARKGIAAGRAPTPMEPVLQLTGLNQSTPPPPPAPGGGLLAETLAEPPGFLGRVETERRVLAGKMKAEVDNSLAEARKIMATSPEQAEQSLKLMLDDIERTPELEPEQRNQLRRQVENAIRQTRQEKIRVDQATAVAQEQRATALERQRIDAQLDLQQQRIKQIVDRFDSLMLEQRYIEADVDIVPEIQKLARGTQIDAGLTYGGRFQRSVHESEELFRRRTDMFLRTMYTVEEALVPFPDEPPIVYPLASAWEDLTIRREKYKAVDLGKQGGAEQKIFLELGKPTNIDVVEMPLKDVVDYLVGLHNIPIVLSLKKLEEQSVSPDTPVTKALRGVTLRSALRLILKDLELTYVVRDEVLQITTPEDAESQLITKVYPVGDLVVPVANFGGMMGGGGGMMGGGMGGGMGGMGGGMGGMGGGMGGMGGGMGGMGGGMGGGMFAVEDELNLGTKKAAPAKAEAAPAAEKPAPRVSRKLKPAERIVVQPMSGETVAGAWDRYFAEQETRISSLADPKVEMQQLLASIRETVRLLMSPKEQKYSEISALIEAALRHGQVESWMYEALALSIRADSADKINKGMTVDASQTEALERALLSAVDFAQDEGQLLMIAVYMAQAGLPQRALSLYQQVAKANPSRPEAYLQGLALAQRLNDVPAIEWACVGILSQAWSGEQRELAERASRIGRATLGQLQADGRKSEAEAFDAAMRRAQERDCVVVLTWTGDADIDLVVEEPAGTVVSRQQSRSISGGVHLGDVSSADGKSTTKGFSEAYVCPEGFAGEYRILVKKVWGKPTSGKVTMDIYTHYGCEEQRVIHEQVPLGEKDTLATFTLKDGRRKEALREEQVASVVKIQNAANRALLAQQIAGLNGPQAGSAGRSFANSLTSTGLAFVPGFFLRGAVGYRPVLSTLPTGAFMNVQSAVISADRRYVRVSPSPNFTQVTEVNTFNFVSGQGGTQAAGAGGVGGAPGGT